MVSAGVCFGGKGRLHLIPDKTKVNAKLYGETLLPEIVQDCRSVLLSGFIFQQDWIAINCSEFIGKDEWPPNSPDLNPLYYHVWGAWTLQVISTQPENIGELKKVLQSIMGPAAIRLDQQSHIELPEKTSGLCESWWWTGRCGHTRTTCQILVFVITVNVSWQWKLQVAVDCSVQNWK